MIFEILAKKDFTFTKTFYYDNQTNILKDDDGIVIEAPSYEEPIKFDTTPIVPFDKNTPLKKSKLITHLKIQMGLSCNYSCDYCSQKFVERPPETNKKDIDAFLQKLEVLEFEETKGLLIEFWGGEPFVYWKTFKPLAEALQEKFADWKTPPKFSVITNGSILTKEICAWLYYMNFSVSISHDGPGQSARGPDPFEDEQNKKIVMDLYKVLRPTGRISFNSMMNTKNQSRKAVRDWFINFTGDPNVILAEGHMVDAYDEDGLSNSLQTKKDHFQYRRKALSDILETETLNNNSMLLQKVNTFIDDVLYHKPADIVGQKCGMDSETTLAIDMKGNVLTCQNVSAVETGMNGESHLGGNLDNYDDVRVKTATHWKNRKECSSCPVLHLCKGSCMFLDGKYWEHTCNNAYSDNVVFFSAAFMMLTKGYIPVMIRGEVLPLDRQDVWGELYKHEEEPKKKVIPIKVISEKIGTINNVEVYGKSKVEELM